MTLLHMLSMTAEQLATEVAEMRKAASEILVSASKRREFLRRVGLPVGTRPARKARLR